MRLASTYHARARWLVAALAAVALNAAGCNDSAAVQDAWPGAANTGAAIASPLDSAAVSAPLASTAVEVAPRYEELAQEIATNHEAAFRVRPPAQVLNEIELVFFATNRIFELADYYAEAVERQGDDAPMRPRYAWLLQRLGQFTHARAQAERAIAATPNDATAHFVLGFVLGQQADPDDDDAISAANQAFAQAYAIAPHDWVGPGGVSRMDLAQQVGSAPAPQQP